MIWIKEAKYCQDCESECLQLRPIGCEHKCSIGKCKKKNFKIQKKINKNKIVSFLGHQDPCPKCKQLKKMKCHCKNNFVYIECSKWTSSLNKCEQDDLQSCKVPCPLQVKFICFNIILISW